MRLESKKILEDIRIAAAHIIDFTTGINFDDYSNNEMLQSAVERQFEIIGEAVKRLSASDPDIVSKIENYERIISFRNILIHGYDVIENTVVWDIIQQDLPQLYNQIQDLLGD